MSSEDFPYSQTSPRYTRDDEDDIVSDNEIVSENELENVDIDTDDELNNVAAEDGLNINEEGSSGDLNVYRCVVCGTLPFKELFQCQQGHLICAGCYQIRVLDKMLGADMGTCSQCGVRIYRHQQYRNLVGERRLSDIVVACEKCEIQLPRGQLRLHGIKDCPKRLVTCKFKRIGCNWKGTIGVLEKAIIWSKEQSLAKGTSDLREIEEKISMGR